MKCEMIRDLLPLYIDGITSEVSNKEIEAHLKECSGCRQCYQEMSGKLPDILPKAEINEAEIIKKAGRKRKRIQRLAVSALSITGAICLILGIVVLIGIPRKVRYEDVLLEYGVTDSSVKYDDTLTESGESSRDYVVSLENGVKSNSVEAYVEIKPKAGRLFDLSFSGSTYVMQDEQGQNIGTANDWIVNRIGGTGQGCRFTSDCNDRIAEWTLVFSDKIVVIRNGEMVSIEDVE